MNEVFELVAVEKLVPHERINNDAANELHQKLIRENTWTDPIIVSPGACDGLERAFATYLLENHLNQKTEKDKQ
ncbi:hypothetical protein ACO0KY_00620 [Undibacterium sp. Dicai25W]|uniref:hypothetical protein n=1 Tax=Undibacterium sp. Dicai25W TaxID=3413034 RepID=UPI003BF0C3BD